MGAGASIPESIDKATALELAGNAFDEAAFEQAAVNGCVSREAFLEAAQKEKKPEKKPLTDEEKAQQKEVNKALKQEVNNIYFAMDHNRDGYLSIDELREYASKRGLDDDQITQLHAVLDTDGDGYVSKEEMKKGLNGALGKGAMKDKKPTLKMLQSLSKPPEDVDFSVFWPERPDQPKGSAFRIPDTARRAVTLEQLTTIANHVANRFGMTIEAPLNKITYGNQGEVADIRSTAYGRYNIRWGLLPGKEKWQKDERWLGMRPKAG